MPGERGDQVAGPPPPIRIFVKLRLRKSVTYFWKRVGAPFSWNSMSSGLSFFQNKHDEFQQAQVHYGDHSTFGKGGKKGNNTFGLDKVQKTFNCGPFLVCCYFIRAVAPTAFQLMSINILR
jgi:hypothetical protein